MSFKSGTKEQDRTAQIIKFVNERTNNFVWRNNTGKWQIIKKYFTKNGWKQIVGWLHNGTKGSPDIVGYTPEGYFLGIETKVPLAKLSDDQKVFAKRLRETKNGIYIVAREHEDILEKLMGVQQKSLLD